MSGALEVQRSVNISEDMLSDLTLSQQLFIANVLDLNIVKTRTQDLIRETLALTDVISSLTDEGTENSIREALQLTDKKEAIARVLQGETFLFHKSTVVWDQIEVSDDLVVSFKDTNLPVNDIIKKIEEKGVSIYIYNSFNERNFLNRELKGSIRVINSLCNVNDSIKILQEACLSILSDNKLECFTAMLIIYLKDLSGVDLTNNERCFLNCFDNRNTDASMQNKKVACGASSEEITILKDGSIRAQNFRKYEKLRYPSGLLK